MLLLLGRVGKNCIAAARGGLEIEGLVITDSATVETTTLGVHGTPLSEVRGCLRDGVKGGVSRTARTSLPIRPGEGSGLMLPDHPLVRGSLFGELRMLGLVVVKGCANWLGGETHSNVGGCCEPILPMMGTPGVTLLTLLLQSLLPRLPLCVLAPMVSSSPGEPCGVSRITSLPQSMGLGRRVRGAVCGTHAALRVSSPVLMGSGVAAVIVWLPA